MQQSSKKEIGLIISKTNNKTLSSEEIAFNKHSLQIESLRKQIESDQVKFDKLASYFQLNLVPLQASYADDLFELVKAFYDIYKNEKTSKANHKRLKEIILSNLNEAFQFVFPTDEVKLIYDDLAPRTFDQESKKMMEEMIQSTFGLNVDLNEAELSEEGMVRKMAEVRAQYEREQAESFDKDTGRKKSNKEIELEIKNKQAEELTKKNIRSIYLSLVKMLHPDLEIDERLKLEREILMKEVTAAYQNKDLHTLLKHEFEIIHKQSENLHHLTDEKLKFFNSALKEQILQLKDELALLRNHPRYQNIAEFMQRSESAALKSIKAKITRISSMQTIIQDDTLELRGKNRLKFATSILQSFENEQELSLDDLSPKDLRDFMAYMDQMNDGGSRSRGRSRNKNSNTNKKRR
jgi:hypothetical protein